MKNKQDEKLEITKSSGNIFADLNIPNPERHLAKVELTYQINSIIKKRSWTQAEAAKVLGIDQPKISALSCGRVSDFSIERLIGFLNKLHHDVEIVVKSTASRRKGDGHLRVAFA